MILVQIKVLEMAIHHSMSRYQSFDMKTNLYNFLTLNSEHRRLSFTYLLNRFDYSTNSLIEYLVNPLDFPDFQVFQLKLINHVLSLRSIRFPWYF